MSNIIYNVFDYMQNTSYPGGIMHKMKDYLNGQRLSGNSNKMLFQWLRKNGYTGNLNEMIAKFGKDNPTLMDGFIQDPINISASVSSDYTFSRTGGQTGVNSASQIYQAERKNLLLYSEQFDNAAQWVVGSNTSVTANTAAAPSGTTTADTVTTTNIANSLRTLDTAVVANTTYTFSVYVQRGTATNLKWSIYNVSGAADIVASTSYFSQTLADGWARCSLSFQTPTACTSIRVFPLRDSGAAGTVYFWGAQLEQNPTATAYIPTTSAAVTVSDPAYVYGQDVIATNLVTYSEDFGNAAWSKTASTITDDTITAPNGTTTADKLVATAVSSEHNVNRSISTVASTAYTFSVYLKAAEYSWAQLRANGLNANFDLANGVLGSLDSGVSATIASVGNGWYRCTHSYNATGASFAVIRATTANNTSTFTGDGTSGIYIWGAQLQTGTQATAYIPTTANQVTTYTAPYNQGILLEGARTNLLTYSRDMTNAAWTKTDTTITRNQTGADGAASSACLATEGSAGTAIWYQQGAIVTAGATVNGSFILKRGNTDWIQIQVTDSGSNGSKTFINLATGALGTKSDFGTGGSSSSSVSALGNGWYRVSLTSIPSATYTTPRIVILSASADNSNTRVSGATYTVDYAQLEAAPFASSPIETVAAAVTRNATSLSRSWTLPANNFSGQIVFRQGFNKTVTGGNAGIISFSDGTTLNRLQIYSDNAGNIYYVKSIGGVVSSNLITATVYSIGQRISLRFRADSTGVYFWFNSETKDSFTTGIAPDSWSPVLTQLKLGADGGGTTSTFVDTTVESLKLWHESKSDAFLAALT